MKILFGSIVTDARGRLNGHVFKKTQFGNSITALGLPRNRYLWQQNPAMQRNVAMLAYWNTLSEADKNLANVFSAQNPQRNKFGVLVNIGGRAMLVKLSNNISYPAVEMSHPLDWNSVVGSVDVAFQDISGSTGFLSFETSAQTNDFEFKIYVQRTPRSRITANQNRWRRIRNQIIDGDGLYTVNQNIFALVGSPSSAYNYWVKIVKCNTSGYEGETISSVVPIG